MSHRSLPIGGIQPPLESPVPICVSRPGIRTSITTGPTSSSTPPAGASPIGILDSPGLTAVSLPHDRFGRRPETAGNGQTKALCHPRHLRGKAYAKKEIRADRLLEDCHSYHPHPHRGYDHLSYAALAVPTMDSYILHPPAPQTVNRSVQNVTMFTDSRWRHHALWHRAPPRSRTNPGPVHGLTGCQSNPGA